MLNHLPKVGTITKKIPYTEYNEEKKRKEKKKYEMSKSHFRHLAMHI